METQVIQQISTETLVIKIGELVLMNLLLQEQLSKAEKAIGELQGELLKYQNVEKGE